MGSECGSFDVKELPLFLNAVLKKAQFISHKEKQDLNTLEADVVVLDGTLRLSKWQMIANDLERLNLLSKVFEEIISAMNYN